MYLFCTNFVSNGSESPRLSEIFYVCNEFDSSFCDNLNFDCLSLGKEAVYGRIYMNKLITCKEGCLVRLLHSVHCLLVRPHFKGLEVLEPGAAVVDGCDVGTCIVISFSFYLHNPYKVFLGHSGISAVIIYLIKGGGKHNWSIIAFCCAEGGLDYGR